MGVYFSGQAASQLFVFAGSKSIRYLPVTVIQPTLTHVTLKDFTKGHMAANYYFWITALEPTIQETVENKDKGPRDGCKSFDLSDVQFAYPLAPHKQVLKGVSLNVSQR